MPSRLKCTHLQAGKQLKEWVDTIGDDATLLFDCDGVLWSGDRLYERVLEGMTALRRRGYRFAFVSNNATLSRRQYTQKFKRLGLDWVTESMVFTSGSASAVWIKNNLIERLPEQSRTIYLIGQPGLEEELKAEGLAFKGGSAEGDNVFLPYQDFSAIEQDPSIGIVLHGFDMHFSLIKYAKAYNYLKSNRGCRLVLTNADEEFLDRDVHLPGEGRLASILIGASSRRHIVVGKPENPLLDIIKAAYKLDPASTYFIGDNIAIDMPFAKRGGFTSIWVKTGVSKEEDLQNAPEEDVPDYVLDSVGDFASI